MMSFLMFYTIKICCHEVQTGKKHHLNSTFPVVKISTRPTSEWMSNVDAQQHEEELNFFLYSTFLTPWNTSWQALADNFVIHDS